MQTPLTMDQVNFTTTKSKGWEQKCKEWADANESFEIHSIESSHFTFCQNFCARHNYQYQFQIRAGEYVAIFTPPPPEKIERVFIFTRSGRSK
jgi:hypothetical protein